MRILLHRYYGRVNYASYAMPRRTFYVSQKRFPGTIDIIAHIVVKCSHVMQLVRLCLHTLDKKYVLHIIQVI